MTRWINNTFFLCVFYLFTSVFVMTYLCTVDYCQFEAQMSFDWAFGLRKHDTYVSKRHVWNIWWFEWKENWTVAGFIVKILLWGPLWPNHMFLSAWKTWLLGSFQSKTEKYFQLFPCILKLWFDFCFAQIHSKRRSNFDSQ